MRKLQADFDSSIFGKKNHYGLITQDPEMIACVEHAYIASGIERPVLLLGETGVGKEVLARYIHGESGGGSENFKTLHGGAIESDLFDAAKDGTVFLDEIGDFSFEEQTKLLRILSKEGTSNVRIIAATNVDIEADVLKGKFREDLYYRLKGFGIHIPPLRERSNDIDLLAEFFLNEAKGEEYSFSDEAMAAMKDYGWRGNVRELESTVLHGLTMCAYRGKDEVIQLGDIESELVPLDYSRRAVLPVVSEDTTPQSRGLSQPVYEDDSLFLRIGLLGLNFESLQLNIISACLKKNGDNLQKTLENLDVSYREPKKLRKTIEEQRPFEFKDDFDELVANHELTLKEYKFRIAKAVYEHFDYETMKTAKHFGITKETLNRYLSMDSMFEEQSAKESLYQEIDLSEETSGQDKSKIFDTIGFSGLSLEEITAGIIAVTLDKNEGDCAQTLLDLGITEQILTRFSKDHMLVKIPEFKHEFSLLIQQHSLSLKDHKTRIIDAVSQKTQNQSEAADVLRCQQSTISTHLRGDSTPVQKDVKPTLNIQNSFIAVAERGLTIPELKVGLAIASSETADEVAERLDVDYEVAREMLKNPSGELKEHKEIFDSIVLANVPDEQAMASVAKLVLTRTKCDFGKTAKLLGMENDIGTLQALLKTPEV